MKTALSVQREMPTQTLATTNSLHSLGGQGAAEPDVVVRVRGRIVPISRPTAIVRAVVPIAAGIQPAQRLTTIYRSVPPFKICELSSKYSCKPLCG